MTMQRRTLLTSALLAASCALALPVAAETQALGVRRALQSSGR